MEYREIDREITAAAHGKDKMKLIRKGWEKADADKNRHKQIQYRLDYIEESVFYDDLLEMYIVYPEVLKLHDEQIKDRGYDELTTDILWQYKCVVENAKDFYQVSLKQYEMFFADAKKRYMENNFSLRPLYQHRFTFFKEVDKEEAAKAYKEYLKCKRDRLSDCLACERSIEVEYLLSIGEIGQAAKKAEPLFEGEMRCGEEPECTYGRFLRYYDEKIVEGDEDYIEPASNLCETLRAAIARKGAVAECIPDVLMHYALTQPTKALNYYKKQWPFYESCRNPHMRYSFAMAAVCFFNSLGDKKTYKMSLNSGFPFYNESNTYNVEELKAYYANSALDIAKKLDNRNGNTLYHDRFMKWTKQDK